MPIQFARADGLRSLIELAFREEIENYRAEARHPYFRPVTLLPHFEPGRRYSAFSRDVSEDGIGLLHNMELKLAPVTIWVPGQHAARIVVSAEICWCKPCGEGWYISGGRFCEF